ncbi:molybdopterin-guanine dinucleotide biosynthesis protein B [Alteribacillus sp. JSM 102045]|uniref:molybdopterin-guanine dinucleotide biosynthesis protein B n=1 Tax=Alteribacillus sp. JSM 102045 TaxID=1562101 RepID=UPI0035C183F5
MAVGQHCPILQIIGYQNSGKTTLMEKLIAKSSSLGLQTASIKHHGHGGRPSDETVAKDSSRHKRAGAFLSSVEGSGLLQLQASKETWALEDIIDLYQYFHPDLIFVEGYKHAAYPKVVLLRDQKDAWLLEQTTNVFCIISHETMKIPVSVPHFLLQDDEKYLEYIFQKVRKQDE